MVKLLKDLGKTPVPPNKANLNLVSSAPLQKLTFIHFLHFLYFFLPHLLVIIPLRIIWHHLIARWRSPIVQTVGRPFYSDFVVKLSQTILGRANAAQARIVFNRKQAYDLTFAGPHFRGHRDWITHVDEKGVTGRWMAPPGTKRSEDDVVLLFIHGGGFVLDTASSAQVYFLKLAKELNLRRNVQFSIFSPDYELAPEFKYPSQQIEVLASYHYLVNTLGISEDKIVVSGDSAGGNLAIAFLLHLARPNPAISVPKELGPTPGKPGSALLVSPFVNLASFNTSRSSNVTFDFIENGGAYRCALDYVGEATTIPSAVPSWNPINLFLFPHPNPPSGVLLQDYVHDVQNEGDGLELLNSPYVNPSVCRDSEWWKEALPGAGRTMITWGGKEIFADDIADFVKVVTAAGVEPVPVCKPLGVHDWLLYDSFIPGVHKTRSKGPDADRRYNLTVAADFLQAVKRNSSHPESTEQSEKPSFASVAAGQAAGESGKGTGKL